METKEQRAAFDKMAFQMVVDCHEGRTPKQARREAARQMGVSGRRVRAAIRRMVEGETR